MSKKTGYYIPVMTQEEALKNIVGLVETCGPGKDGKDPSYFLPHEIVDNYRWLLLTIAERAQAALDNHE